MTTAPPNTATATSSTTSKPSAQNTGNTPFRIKSLRKESAWLKMMVYGAPGVGKTTLLGSACDVDDMQSILQIGCESGNLSLFDNSRISNPERIDEIRITSYQQIPSIHKWLLAHCKHRDENNVKALIELEKMFTGRTDKEIADNGGPKMYRTVMVDSLTEIEAYCMYGLLGFAGDIDLSKVGNNPKTAEFKEYKQLNNMINMFLRAMRDLPIHFLVTCGESFDKDEMQRQHYEPALTGKTAKQSQAYFDVVAWLSKGKTDEGKEFYRAYLEKGARFDAKCRFAGYNKAYIDNATMKSLTEAFGFSPEPATFEDQLNKVG